MVDAPARVLVAIPSIGHSDCLWPLIDVLRQEPEVARIVVYDNSPSGVMEPAVDLVADVVYVPMPGQSIYVEWNSAICEARRLGWEYVALLNDDIMLPAGAMTEMAAALEADPGLWLVCPDAGLGAAIHRPPKQVEMVQGTWSQGGVCGFAMMVRAASCPLVDEDFEVWYGDDDLVEKILAAGGRCGRLKGLGVCHETSMTVNSTPGVLEAIGRDRARWTARHS